MGFINWRDLLNYWFIWPQVDPEPYYQMCVNDMCTLETEEERAEKICEVYQAYLSQNKAGFPVQMPSHCSKLDLYDLFRKMETSAFGLFSQICTVPSKVCTFQLINCLTTASFKNGGCQRTWTKILRKYILLMIEIYNKLVSRSGNDKTATQIRLGWVYW